MSSSHTPSLLFFISLFSCFQGATTAHRLFHTRVLPHILLRGRQEGLPFEFHEDARAVCERMGGPQGDLLSGSKIKSKRPLVQAAA